MTRVRLSRKCQVLIVGAGPAGLVAGITLARYGIDVVLVDKRNGVSGLSRSLVISTRGMELMRRFGLETPIRSRAADVKIRAWVTPDLSSGVGTEMSLGYPSDAEAALASPTRPAWVAQDHHEPILAEHLCSLPSARVRFGCELQELTPDERGVEATVLDIQSGDPMRIRAEYVVAADGAHSTVREQLGLAMVGRDSLGDYERVEFVAPLWPLVAERRYGLYVITRPDVSGVLVARGVGDRWGLAREIPVGSRGLLDLDDDARIDIVRRAVGNEDVQPQIERITTWTFAAQLADRYAAGRCFLVGDAAHRMTPRGGTGMNTAIQDAFDIGWKLAWVLRGWAAPDLLASYERERRPVAAYNVERTGDPNGARRTTDEALPWDLNGRIAHRWIRTGDEARSTLDLIGDGLTVLAGPADPRWRESAGYLGWAPPVDVHLLDAATADALDLPSTGALLARPDGRELTRWPTVGAARTAATERPQL